MTFSDMVRRDENNEVDDGLSSSKSAVPSESPLGKLQQLAAPSVSNQGGSVNDDQFYKMMLDPNQFRKKWGKKPKEVFMPPSYICDPKKVAKSGNASMLPSSKASSKTGKRSKGNVIDMSDELESSCKGITIGSGRGVTIGSDRGSNKL